MRGNDRGLPDLEKRLKILERELEFERFISEATKPLRGRNLRKQSALQQAQRLGFKEKDQAGTVEALDRIMKADDSLMAARNRLAKMEFDEHFSKLKM